MDNNVEKLLTNQKLFEEKEKLERELEEINEKIEDYQKTCDHIAVYTGWDGLYQCRDSSYCECLFCREKDPKTRYPVIDAAYYDEYHFGHGQFSWYRSDRMIKLQNVAYTMLKDNQEMTNEELVNELRTHIAKDREEYKIGKEEKDKTLSRIKTSKN